MKKQLPALLLVLFSCLVVTIIYYANQGTLHTIVPWLYRIPFYDKVSHFILIGVLAFLVNLVLKCKEISILNTRVLLGSFIVLLLVTCEEISQAFIPHRNFDLFDLLFDVLGIIFFQELAKKMVPNSSETKIS